MKDDLNQMRITVEFGHQVEVADDVPEHILEHFGIDGPTYTCVHISISVHGDFGSEGVPTLKDDMNFYRYHATRIVNKIFDDILESEGMEGREECEEVEYDEEFLQNILRDIKIDLE